MQGNILEIAVKYCIKDPANTSVLKHLKNVLAEEDYIIFFYIDKVSANGVKLDASLLQHLLKANAIYWLDPKLNHYKHLGRVIKREYLASLVQETINLDEEYAQVLSATILRRFNELNKDLEHLPDIDSMLPTILEEIEYREGVALLADVVELNKKKTAKVGKQVYTDRQIIQYLKHRMKSIETDDILTSEDYSAKVESSFIDAVFERKTILEFNLGKDAVLPDLALGHHMSLIGQSKIGKTSFAVGEIIYPLLMKGINVEYDSCEMPPHAMYAKLIVKHAYAKLGYKFNQADVKLCLGMSFLFTQYNTNLEDLMKDIQIREQIQKGDLSAQAKLPDELYSRYVDNKKEFKKYEKLDNGFKTMVAILYYDLFKSGNYGKLYIYMISDKVEDVFCVDDIVDRTNKRVLRDNTTCVIRDHAGHFYSKYRDKSEVQVLKEVYKSGEVIAGNKERPILVVTLNHIDTVNSSKISALGDDRTRRANARAYGTSESDKSTDLEVAMYATEEDRKKGYIRWDIKVSRHTSITGVQLLVADNGTCDYYIYGLSKLPYKTYKDE